MTVMEKGALDVLLFESDDQELLDIKCFRGDRADVTAEEIEAEIHSAIVQFKMHPEIASATAPDLSAKAVDMAELVQRLPVAA